MPRPRFFVYEKTGFFFTPLLRNTKYEGLVMRHSTAASAKERRLGRYFKGTDESCLHSSQSKIQKLGKRLEKDEFYLFHQSRFLEPPSNKPCSSKELRKKMREAPRCRALERFSCSKNSLKSPPWQQSLRRDFEPGNNNRTGGRYAKILQQFRSSVNSMEFERKVANYCRDPDSETPAMMSYCERLKDQAAAQRKKRQESEDEGEDMESSAKRTSKAKQSPTKQALSSSRSELDKGLSNDADSLRQQIAVLKSASGLTDAEIAWRVLSSQGDAYVIASNKLEEAETSYERSLHESGVAQAQIRKAEEGGRWR
jgi:hypothetical protein